MALKKPEMVEPSASGMLERLEPCRVHEIRAYATERSEDGGGVGRNRRRLRIAENSISFAFQHTKQQLFQPFRFGQWTKLAVVGLLAGELGSGGFNGSNFQFPHQPGMSRHLYSGTWGGIDPALLAAWSRS